MNKKVDNVYQHSFIADIIQQLQIDLLKERNIESSIVHDSIVINLTQEEQNEQGS